MGTKRTIEIFSAGCPVCQDAVKLVNRIACPSCDVTVLDMHEKAVADRARLLAIQKVPAVVVDGALADCCQHGAVDEAGLRRAGVGQPVP